MLSLPVYIIDCEYDEEEDDEKTAFTAAFENTLSSAKLKKPYNPQGATAATPINVKLEEEKKFLEKEKEAFAKKA
jgi:hypothetical protein